MIPDPASDAELLAIFKQGSEHSLPAALRAIYDRGMSDLVTADADSKKDAGTIDGPFGADAPFVPTSATPDEPPKRPLW